MSRQSSLLRSANHSDSSGLARSLALSFSRVAAARRIPVLPTSYSGIRDSSRAPDTRAGMTEKFDRADVRVTILCRTQYRGRALSRARTRDESVDFCEKFPAIHRFGQVVITAFVERTLAVFGRRMRGYRNNRDLFPALLSTQKLHKCQSIILTERKIQQDQANVGPDLKHLAGLCIGS